MHDTPHIPAGALIGDVVSEWRQTPARWLSLRLAVAAAFVSYWLLAAVWSAVIRLWFRRR